MLLSYIKEPKASDMIEMVCMLTWVCPLFKFWLDICHIVSPSIYCGYLGTRWIRSVPHQQTWPVLQSFPFPVKINMGKNITESYKRQGPKTCWCRTQGQGKCYEKNERKYFKRCKKVAEILPIQARILPALLPIQAMILPALLTIQARPNDTYVYGVGILAILAIGVYVFFAYNTSQPKKLISEKKD